jgi:hypothetical protein
MICMGLLAEKLTLIKAAAHAKILAALLVDVGRFAARFVREAPAHEAENQLHGRPPFATTE